MKKRGRERWRERDRERERESEREREINMLVDFKWDWTCTNPWDHFKVHLLLIQDLSL